MQQASQTRPQFGIYQIGIILFTVVTAVIHLILGFQPDEDLHVLFLLNGLGYLALLIAFFLPQLANLHNAIRWVFVAYTILTIILWFFLGSPSKGHFELAGVITKIDEVALVACLFMETRNPTLRSR